MPLRLITVTGFVNEVLTIVSVPVAGPVTIGLNSTFSAAVWPPLSDKGNTPPDTEKPEPATMAAVTVTGKLPDEERVSVCVATVFRFTFPNSRLVLLMASTGPDPANCKANDCITPPALAVNVAVCVKLTADTAALNSALVAPAGTVKVGGTTTALLLLAKPMTNPPLPAATFRNTVQLSFPLPAIELLAQVRPSNVGSFGVPPPWAFNCNANVSTTPPALAVSVTLWADVTATAVAVKLALLAPAGTVTEVGTVTALLLLVILTTNPTEVAVPLSVTVQLSAPAPVNEEFAQLNVLSATDGSEMAPVPFKAMTIVPLLTEFETIVN